MPAASFDVRFQGNSRLLPNANLYMESHVKVSPVDVITIAAADLIGKLK